MPVVASASNEPTTLSNAIARLSRTYAKPAVLLPFPKFRAHEIARNYRRSQILGVYIGRLYLLSKVSRC